MALAQRHTSSPQCRMYLSRDCLRERRIRRDSRAALHDLQDPQARRGRGAVHSQRTHIPPWHIDQHEALQAGGAHLHHSQKFSIYTRSATRHGSCRTLLVVRMTIFYK